MYKKRSLRTGPRYWLALTKACAHQDRSQEQRNNDFEHDYETTGSADDGGRLSQNWVAFKGSYPWNDEWFFTRPFRFPTLLSQPVRNWKEVGFQEHKDSWAFLRDQTGQTWKAQPPAGRVQALYNVVKLGPSFMLSPSTFLLTAHLNQDLNQNIYFYSFQTLFYLIQFRSIFLQAFT